MLRGNFDSFDIGDDSSSIIDFIVPPSIFIPRTDHNINLFLKSQINKFENISLPKYENEQKNRIKREHFIREGRHTLWVCGRGVGLGGLGG